MVQYTSADQVLPTSVTTGDGTTLATTTSYVYDDFAEPVQFVGPDSGTTRIAYDEGGRSVVRREGFGTSDQRTVQTTYDSLGRVVFVDHDLEHPVDCATASDGTPITDEEYFYDTCPTPLPTDFTCGSFPAGHLTVARVKLHCSSGSAFKRATWYQYGPTGRLATVAVADDSTMGMPFLTQYEWTSGGRARKIGNPLSGAYGMKYVYDPTGQISEIRQTDAIESPYITAVTHAPFGPIAGYTTGALSGGQAMVIETGRYLDYSVQTKHAKRGGVIIGGFTYMRDETGRVISRDSRWGGPAPLDRWYQYDRAGRLLCETTTSQTECPDSGPALRTTLMYTNGQMGLAPNNRSRAVLAAGTGVPPGATGNYSYSVGSNRLISVDTLSLYYDAVGRRIKDDDSRFFDVNDDARTYTYLPNGRLGTIHGREAVSTAAGTDYFDYTVAIAYDHLGRVFSWSYTTAGAPGGDGIEQYVVHFDNSDRILAVTRSNSLVGSNEGSRTWHFAYLGKKESP
jgi:hypothetical protein